MTTSNHNFTYSNEIERLFQIYEITYFILLYTISLPGLLLNFLTILVFFLCKKFWINDNKMGFLMIIQTLSANGVIAAGIFSNSRNSFDCRLKVLCECSINIFLIFVHLIITIDRYLAIKNINKIFFLFKNKKNLLIIFIGLFVISILLTIPSLYNELESINDYYREKILIIGICMYEFEQRLIFIIFYSLFRCLPILLMFFMNISLTNELIRSKLKLNKTRSLRREYKFAVTLIFVNSILFISSLPIFFVFIYMIFIYDLKTLLIVRFCSFPYIFFESFHFFYHLFFNELFRKELKNIFIAKKN